MFLRSVYARLFYALAATVVVVAAGCGLRPSAVLRVATLNVAHGRGLATSQVGLPRETFEQNLRAVADVLIGQKLDVVALQEADAPSAWSGRFDHVEFLAESAGFPHVHHALHVNQGPTGLRLRYGTALLSRSELTNCGGRAFRIGLLDTKGYAAARIQFAGRPLTVVSVHLDHASARRREQQARKLIDDLRCHRGGLIIMGDFNTTWERPGDGLRLIADALRLRVYKPASVDCATYPATTPRRRLDWILISADLRFRKCRVWPECVSDHRAVLAELEWR